MSGSNNDCRLPGTKYASIESGSNYTGTISQKSGETLEFGSAFMQSGTFDTANKAFTIRIGKLGSQSGAGVTFNVIGGGELAVAALGANALPDDTLTLANVNLNASVRVLQGGSVTVGQLNFAIAQPQRWFFVFGEATFKATVPGAAGSYNALKVGNTYYTPIRVQPGAYATFQGTYTVNGYVFNEGGITTLDSGAVLTITGDSGPGDPAQSIPNGFNAGYLSSGLGSQLALYDATLTATSPTATHAVNILGAGRLTIVGSGASHIAGNVELNGLAVWGTIITVPAFLEFDGESSMTSLSINGSLKLTSAIVVANLSYEDPMTNTTLSVNRISCGDLELTNATYKLNVRNPNAQAPFQFLQTLIATNRPGATDFTNYDLPVGIQGSWNGNVFRLSRPV